MGTNDEARTSRNLNKSSKNFLFLRSYQFTEGYQRHLCG